MLDFVEDEENIFTHSKEYDQGLGKIRRGAVTYVVAKDGSGDYGNIKEAIKALPSEGGKIQIKGGIYPEQLLNITKNNIVIEGMGLDRPEIRLGNANGFLISGAYYVVLDNLYITGGNIVGFYAIHFKNANDCSIKNCYISQMTGVKLTNESNRNKIINNVFFSGIDDGLIISGSHRNIIEGNYLSEATNNGIWLAAGAKNNIINGNTIYECYEGIYIQSGANTIITNNNVCNDDLSTYDSSIWIDTSSSSSIITGNNLLGIGATIFINDGINSQIGHNITE